MRIAVLESNLIQIELYKLWLSTAQHQFQMYSVGADLLAALKTEKFDLLLCDVSLPDGTGDKVLSWVRENLGWSISIIVVTARDAESDAVNALRMGADDYMVKPPKYFELIARIEALGRRNRAARQQVLKLGVYEIHQENRKIMALGELVELTQKEYEVACYLFQNPGRLLSRVHLLEVIWGLQAEIDTRTVDTHISRLRRKLHIYPENGWEIISVYGYGYRIEIVERPAAFAPAALKQL
ncbi:MAG: two-component system response regulator RegX3 [Janthinobacterium sp.]|jgi:two-component system response regulator RegX3